MDDPRKLQTRRMRRRRVFADIAALAIVGGFFGTVALAVGVLLHLAGSAICAANWPDFETRNHVFVGCQVKIDGVWVPENHVRIDTPTKRIN